MTDHLEKLERMYHEAVPINDVFDPTISIEEGRAELELPVSETLFHPAGAVHGAAYFKAADDAAFFAVNSLVDDVFGLTTQLDLHLTRPISSGTIRAVGEVTDARPEQYVAESVLSDDDGNRLGHARGTFVPSDIELSPEIGYE